MNCKAILQHVSHRSALRRMLKGILICACAYLLQYQPVNAQVTLTFPDATTNTGANSLSVISTANTGAGIFQVTLGTSTVDALFAETTGNGWGVFGKGKKNGVYGFATKNSGATYGVKGKVNSPDGWAGYFEGRGYFSGNVGIGVLAPTVALQVAGAVSISHSGSDAFSVTQTGGNDAGIFKINNAASAAEAVEATTNGSGNAVLAYTTGTGNAGEFRTDNAANSVATLFSKTIGTGQAGYFQIDNAANDSAALYATSNGTGYSLRGVHTGSSGNAGRFEITNSSNASSALYATTNGTGNALYVLHSGSSNNAGEFYISNSANSSGVIYAHTDGTGRGGTFEINNSSNTRSAIVATTNGTGNAVYAENSGTSNNAGEFRITNASNASAALYCETAGTGPALWANGTAKVDVLEITGADVAEKFPASEKIEPGMVVAIDPKNPGQLCLSREAYNHRVAGVVSGANDLPVGAVLGHLPGNEQGVPIALSGRVWVYCDATKRAIEPGDLLATAERPGYAMAVSNHVRAQGAILGKAMTRLKKGETGLVLVLVNLQ